MRCRIRVSFGSLLLALAILAILAMGCGDSDPTSVPPVEPGFQWTNTLDFHLFDVWGASAADVFAVGQYRSFLHFDGESWSAWDSGTRANLYDLHGSSGQDVHVATEWSGVLRYGN